MTRTCKDSRPAHKSLPLLRWTLMDSFMRGHDGGNTLQPLTSLATHRERRERERGRERENLPNVVIHPLRSASWHVEELRHVLVPTAHGMKHELAQDDGQIFQCVHPAPRSKVLASFARASARQLADAAATQNHAIFSRTCTARSTGRRPASSAAGMQ